MNTPVRYLIIPIDSEPFLTNYYVEEQHYNHKMVVFDLHTCKYTSDGGTWNDINEDHL